MKKLLSVLCAIAVMMVLFVPVSVLAAKSIPTTAQAAIVTDKTTLSPGDTATVTLKIKLSAEESINGMNFELNYDQNVFKFLEGSTVIRNSSLKDATTYHKTGKLTIVWLSGGQNKFGTEFEVVSIKLTVKDDVTAETAKITGLIKELYQMKGSPIKAYNFTYSSSPAESIISISGNEGPVSNTIKLIDAIGTVEYTEECKNRIQKASEAYSALNAEQKSQVTNYSVLLKAAQDYRKLQNQALSDAEIAAQVKKFKQDHKEALDLNMAKIEAAEDKMALLNKVTSALEAYDALPTGAQAQLVSQRTTLKIYSSKLKEILKSQLEEEERRRQEEEYKKEAAEYVEKFRKENKFTLERKLSEVLVLDESVILNTNSQLQALLSIDGVGVYINEATKSEQAHIKALLDRITELKAAENPEIADEIKKAQAFKEQFSYVLSLKADNLTYDDVFEVQLAYMVLDMMDAKVKDLLKSETELINALYQKSLTLSPTDDYDNNGETRVEYITKTVTETVTTPGATKVVTKNGGADMKLRVNNSAMSVFVIVLLILAVVSTVIFVTLRLMWYHGIVKRRDR